MHKESKFGYIVLKIKKDGESSLLIKKPKKKVLFKMPIVVKDGKLFVPQIVEDVKHSASKTNSFFVWLSKIFLI